MIDYHESSWTREAAEDGVECKRILFHSNRVTFGACAEHALRISSRPVWVGLCCNNLRRWRRMKPLFRGVSASWYRKMIVCGWRTANSQMARRISEGSWGKSELRCVICSSISYWFIFMSLKFSFMYVRWRLGWEIEVESIIEGLWSCFWRKSCCLVVEEEG